MKISHITTLSAVATTLIGCGSDGLTVESGGASDTTTKSRQGHLSLQINNAFDVNHKQFIGYAKLSLTETKQIQVGSLPELSYDVKSNLNNLNGSVKPYDITFTTGNCSTLRDGQSCRLEIKYTKSQSVFLKGSYGADIIQNAIKYSGDGINSYKISPLIIQSFSEIAGIKLYRFQLTPSKLNEGSKKDLHHHKLSTENIYIKSAIDLTSTDFKNNHIISAGTVTISATDQSDIYHITSATSGSTTPTLIFKVDAKIIIMPCMDKLCETPLNLFEYKANTQ